MPEVWLNGHVPLVRLAAFAKASAPKKPDATSATLMP